MPTGPCCGTQTAPLGEAYLAHTVRHGTRLT